MEQTLNLILYELKKLNSRQDRMEEKMENIDTKVDHMEVTINGMETNMNQMATKISLMTTEINQMKTEINNLDESIHRFEANHEEDIVKVLETIESKERDTSYMLEAFNKRLTNVEKEIVGLGKQ